MANGNSITNDKMRQGVLDTEFLSMKQVFCLASDAEMVPPTLEGFKLFLTIIQAPFHEGMDMAMELHEKEMEQ